MSEQSHNPLPVKGYTAQSEDKIQMVNRNKETEAALLAALENCGGDKRWTDVARLHFEQGFMAMNRSILQPQPVEVPVG